MEAVFWTKWSAVGQLAGAAATFAAVVVSLYLARSATRAKATMYAGIMRETSHLPHDQWPRLLVFRIQNTGQRPIHVEMIGWRTGRWPFSWPKWLSRQQAIIGWWDPAYAGHPPFDLPPYKKMTSILPLDGFLHGISEMTGEPFFARCWPFFGLRRATVYAVVHLEEGGFLTTRVTRELQGVLLDAERSRRSAA